MASFLSSFSSEKRSFKRVARTSGGTQNAIGETVKTSAPETDFEGIMFQKGSKAYRSVFNGGLMYDKTSHVLFFELDFTLNKGDQLKDGNLVFEVLHTREVYAFNAQKDCYLSELILIE